MEAKNYVKQQDSLDYWRLSSILSQGPNNKLEAKNYWETTTKKIFLASPGFEPETFSVLDWRDNQLHHETIWCFLKLHYPIYTFLVLKNYYFCEETWHICKCVLGVLNHQYNILKEKYEKWANAPNSLLHFRVSTSSNLPTSAYCLILPPIHNICRSRLFLSWHNVCRLPISS